jgi:DNA repair protein RadD
MKLTPREYQDYAVNSIFAYFSNGAVGNPLVAMPTGTGKSVVIASFLERALAMYTSQRFLVLTHVKELIEQNHEKLMTMWPTAPAGVYSAGLGRRDTMQNIIFGGIASVIKAKEKFGRIDLVLVDECHLVNPEEEGMYRALFEFLKIANPHLKVIGFTATPWKLGHGSIVENGIFTDICCDMTGVAAFNWLITQGYLMPLVPKRTELLLDTDGVHKRGGEFIASELQTAVDKEDITRKAIQEAIKLGEMRNSWLVFAAGVEHACHISEMLNNEFGISSVAVHGKLGKTARKDAIDGFKAGKYRVAVNNNVLTTGFDHPGIDLILMLRPTASAVLWVQMLGRGTRPLYAKGYDLSTIEGRLEAIQQGGKHDCLVLDYAGNTRKLGPINDPVIPNRKGEKGGEAPVKCCEACDTYNHASARQCIYCGAEFLIQTKLKAAASTQAIVKTDMPVVETFKVDHITCTKHVKGDSEMMKVTYYCAYKMFTEYVAPDHEKHNMRAKARAWWKQRSDTTMPPDTDTLLALVNTSLRAPTHLRVWTNQKYPEILAVCFDGTAFGTTDVIVPPPKMDVSSIPIRAKHTPGPVVKFLKSPDADIPFTAEEIAAAQARISQDDADDFIPF